MKSVLPNNYRRSYYGKNTLDDFNILAIAGATAAESLFLTNYKSFHKNWMKVLICGFEDGFLL